MTLEFTYLQSNLFSFYILKKKKKEEENVSLVKRENKLTENMGSPLKNAAA